MANNGPGRGQNYYVTGAEIAFPIFARRFHGKPFRYDWLFPNVGNIWKYLVEQKRK